jgi:3-hydroxymyristoyl/3-hydroxydecanoyl-(acyl carrier protein) dehydratase
MTANLHSIENEKILTQEENHIVLEFVIPEASDFFDGHFPEYKLLPAVAQFEIVTRFSRKYLNTQRFVPSIKRIKFSAPIRPDTKVTLELTKNTTKNTVAFSIVDSNVKDKTYSSGSFNYLEQ